MAHIQQGNRLRAGAGRVDVVQASGASGGTAALAWSAPSLSDGATITFTTNGTYNFGTKTTPAPFLFERFDGMSQGTVLQANDANWHEYAAYGGALLSSADTHSGGVCVTNNLTRGGFATNYRTFTPTDEVYLSYWLKLANIEGNESGAGAVLKICRLGATADIGGGGAYNGAGIHSISSYSPADYNGSTISNGYMSYSNSASNFTQLGYPDIKVNQWVRCEMYVKLSTPGVSNGEFNAGFVNGTGFSYTSQLNRAFGEPWSINSLILGIMHANFTTGALEMYNDDIYIDTTRQRVEIGNNATFSNCTVREPQPALTWGTSSVSCTLNLIGLAGNKWAHFIGANGSVIASLPLQ